MGGHDGVRRTDLSWSAHLPVTMLIVSFAFDDNSSTLQSCDTRLPAPITLLPALLSFLDLPFAFLSWTTLTDTTLLPCGNHAATIRCLFILFYPSLHVLMFFLFAPHHRHLRVRFYDYDTNIDLACIKTVFPLVEECID